MHALTRPFFPIINVRAHIHTHIHTHTYALGTSINPQPPDKNKQIKQ